jgi:hypothetical protein
MTSLPQVLKSIQDEYETETGSRPSKDAAAVLFDEMAAAFNEKIAGAGYVHAARADRRVADYLKNQWVGASYEESGPKLRAACRYLDGVKLSGPQLALIRDELVELQLPVPEEGEARPAKAAKVTQEPGRLIVGEAPVLSMNPPELAHMKSKFGAVHALSGLGDVLLCSGKEPKKMTETTDAVTCKNCLKKADA